MPALIDRYLELDRRPAVILAALVCLIPVAFVLVVPHPLEQPLGVDFDLYRDVTARWLHGGPFFEPRQLAGPYEITPGDVLYPPLAIWLFAPWALAVDPPWSAVAVLWWAIPLGVTAAAVLALRPRPWTWPLLALCASNPTVILKVWTGNPVVWAMAALAVAVLGSPQRAAAPFVLLKPSLAPFALFGVRERSWWLGVALLVGLSVPFGALWLDWLGTVANSRGGGVLYSSLEAPFLILPLVAWLGRTRRLGGPDGATRRVGRPGGPKPRVSGLSGRLSRTRSGRDQQDAASDTRR